MRLRSEWLTLFTMTALVAGALALPRGDTSPAAAKRGDIAAAGIDDMPVGTARSVTRVKAVRSKVPDTHP